ncbi:MAG: Glu-tRNA(Gln) amidotransferase subunit GatE, partial [Candidatus Hydrothermarchaeaceae archaeon]
IGTIRQDINVSIEGGARVEIKGVQDLNQIPVMIEEEAERQQRLIEVKEKLDKRGLSIESKVFDVSDIFVETHSKVIAGQLKKGGKVLALMLAGFRGLLIRRLGPEFAAYARAVAGVRGIFHTDELPAYGVSRDEVDGVSKRGKLGRDDAFVLVAGDEETSRKALAAVFDRAAAAFNGVPEETRMANPDGTTSYMRPLPGAARMYPETDIPPVVISDELLKRVKAELPESHEDRIKRYASHGLSEEMASQLVANSTSFDFGTGKKSICQIYEESVEFNLSPSIVANTLIGTLKELSREGVPVENITGERLLELFRAVADGKMAKEAIPGAIREMAKNPQKALNDINGPSGAFGEKELTEIVRKVIKEREAFVREKGIDAAKPLMGPVMKEARGRADGKLVSDTLRREIERFLSETVS